MRETMCISTSFIPPEHVAVVLLLAVLLIGIFLGIAACNIRDARRSRRLKCVN